MGHSPVPQQLMVMAWLWLRGFCTESPLHSVTISSDFTTAAIICIAEITGFPSFNSSSQVIPLWLANMFKRQETSESDGKALLHGNRIQFSPRQASLCLSHTINRLIDIHGGNGEKIACDSVMLKSFFHYFQIIHISKGRKKLQFLILLISRLESFLKVQDSYMPSLYFRKFTSLNTMLNFSSHPQPKPKLCQWLSCMSTKKKRKTFPHRKTSPLWEWSVNVQFLY